MGPELWQRNEDIPKYAGSCDKATSIYTVNHLELTMRYDGYMQLWSRKPFQVLQRAMHSEYTPSSSREACSQSNLTSPNKLART